MPCTTILVGKKASNNGSTIIARNDDSPSGVFHVKKLVVVPAYEGEKTYKSINSRVEVKLPNKGYRHTLMPNVDPNEGVWGAAGINEKNVAMSATETITSNPRVLGADPYVELKFKDGKESKGGIGEEDLVSLVLPFISNAKEGVIRLGKLLEEYGTYEPNGIAFSDKNDIWWLETIGGHHWIARRVKDTEVVIMPNQFGMDDFDFADAYGSQNDYMCSADLKEFIEKYHLDTGKGDKFNPRLAFGSHDDSDHIYNTPRAWYMGKRICPRTIKWTGEDRDFGPEDDDIPFKLIPEHLLTINDVKYLLSSHYQGTPYDPYGKGDSSKKNIYRPIGVNRTSFLALLEIRNGVEEEISALEWVCFASNAFNAMLPIYANVDQAPNYLNNTTLRVDTSSFYWASRLVSALADAHFQKNDIHIERYQNACSNDAYRLLNKFDEEFKSNKDKSLLIKANEEIARIIQSHTDKVLDKVLFESSLLMKNSFARSDN